ncbi:hypothetical protein RRG08_022492 [Elysia crispata]|uniref:Uncharacterized protein n=1 Tax=Elysia crispata TaxID=231223 RepID=A0AAE0Z1H6_9GAST|nr:hypothetical protein RRG08_022492 [Elysia crispata]
MSGCCLRLSFNVNQSQVKTSVVRETQLERIVTQILNFNNHRFSVTLHMTTLLTRLDNRELSADRQDQERLKLIRRLSGLNQSQAQCPGGEHSASALALAGSPAVADRQSVPLSLQITDLTW